MAQTLLKELNIIILRTHDLEAARAFYRDVMGMSVETEAPNFLQVHPREGQGPEFGIGVGEPSVGGPELWWRTEDADALHAWLVARGVRILAEPTDQPFGRAIEFADPAGNRLYAYQPR
jgi:catechol 2,3-dioxygenase-like lactoylglutathione lyase family enzyme